MKFGSLAVKPFLICLFLLSGHEVHANSDAEKLVKGCNELMGMYKNMSEKRFLASQLASSSDSLLAGFCLGATKAYINMDYISCKHDDWYKLADSVAGMWSLTEYSGSESSVSTVLKKACAK